LLGRGSLIYELLLELGEEFFLAEVHLLLRLLLEQTAQERVRRSDNWGFAPPLC